MLDWDDLRFFLAVARTGSLSAAARGLRCTQSTVGRRLGSLEARLGVRLVNRTPRGYVATPAGESVREHVERIEAEASAIERIVAGRDARLEGKVTVACIESVANNILAPCFAALHRDYPDVIIELLSPTTAKEDRTTKKRIYEQTFHTSEYYLYDPDTQQLEGWRLGPRKRYKAPSARLTSESSTSDCRADAAEEGIRATTILRH